MNTIKVSYLVYAEGADSEGNKFYFEKDKTREINIETTEFNDTDTVLDVESELFLTIEKDIQSYENKRTSYAFNKSNYKKNNIYSFKDDYPGLTIPVGKVKTTRIEIADIEVI
ncbi:MAG: hypothetical protein ACRC92_18890 [Peptostreptococcaceae bacterium]